MKDFDAQITAKLNKPLDRSKVKTLEHGSKAEYIQGWQAIEDANKTFGYGTWSCETIYNREVCRIDVKVGQAKADGYKVGYEAKVRITVNHIVREGTGLGSGVARDLFDCIELAAKEAETDAIKRALRSFGNIFGLALYDKEKKNVGDIEIYDNQFAKAEIALDKIEKKLKEAKDLESINKVWTTNVKDIAIIKSIDKDGMYQKLLNLYKDKKKDANT